MRAVSPGESRDGGLSGGERLVGLATEAASATSPGAALRRLRALRRELDEFERAQVAKALGDGASFAAVGRDLGLSRQAVHRRFRALAAPAPAPAPPEEPSLALSPAVRFAFRHGREEAAALGEPVGGQHLLLGLMCATAVPALTDNGVSLERVRTQVHGSSSRTGLFDRPAAPPDLRSLLAEPARLALRARSRQIEPEHLLGALLREPNSAATRTLRALGVNVAAVRAQLERAAAR